MPKLQTDTKRNHALIIGGGMAGLLAARVLTTHFARVTLIERDRYPVEPVARSGVPQGRHVHTMLLRGQRELEALFPGLGAKLLEQGAVERDYGSESLYYYGGRCPQRVLNLHGWSCSRPLLEFQIRQEVRKCSNLQIMEGYEVLRLLFEKQTQTVSGVQFRARDQHALTNEIQDMSADLVIDASGASSQISDWLVKLGYEMPEETVIDASFGYATRTWITDDQQLWKAVAIQATEQKQRGGMLLRIEGNAFLTVLVGAGQDHPPLDDEGYLAFAKSLPDPALSQALKEATPVSPIVGYRRMENRRRHLERVRNWPDGLLVFGDALCALNPLYGQGMTIAVLQALLLDTCLSSMKPQESFAQIQRQAARVLAFPWRLATSSDARLSGEKQAKGLSQRYVESVVALLPRDPQVLRTFLELLHMLRSPLSLFSPRMLTKVLRQSLWASRRKTKDN